MNSLLLAQDQLDNLADYWFDVQHRFGLNSEVIIDGDTGIVTGYIADLQNEDPHSEDIVKLVVLMKEKTVQIPPYKLDKASFTGVRYPYLDTPEECETERKRWLASV